MLEEYQEIERIAIIVLSASDSNAPDSKMARLRLIEKLRDLTVAAEARAKAMHLEIQDMREEYISGPLKAKQLLESAADFARKALMIEFDREGIERLAGIQLIVEKEQPVIPLEGSVAYGKLLDHLVNVPDVTTTKLDVRAFKNYVKGLDDDDRLYMMEQTGITFEQPKHVRFVEEKE